MFGLVGVACGGVEAGNEADDKTGVDGLRRLQFAASGLRACLRGGVGGVDIQVGVANNMRNDILELGGVLSLGPSTFWASVG